MGDNAAIRLVGWAKHEPGWIDNVEATRTYPGNLADPADDVIVNNAEFAEDNYNTIDTVGARAALRIDLGDNWTLTPSLMYQKSEQEGSWGDDVNDFIPEAAGKNKVAHFRDEFYNDEWYQAGLTIEGSIGNFDVVYSGNYLNREDDGSTDYSDYSYFYDHVWSTGPYAGTFANLFVDNDGNYLNRAHAYTADDYYTKTSHEVRISTPQDKRVRGLLGFFYQKQYHDFHEEFGVLEGLADFMSMNFLEPGSQQFPGVVYLNSMDRTDYEEAVFGQIQFDITDTLELSLGARYFDVEGKVHGFFGFGLGFNPGRVPGSSDGDIQPTEPGEPPGGSGASCPEGRLVPQWRVALPLAGGSQGRPLRQRRPQCHRERQRLPRQPELEGDRYRPAVCDLVRGIPPRAASIAIRRCPTTSRTSSPTMSWAGRPAWRTTGCNSTAPCSWRSGTTSRWPSRA